MSVKTLRDIVAETEPEKIDDEYFIAGVEGCPSDYEFLDIYKQKECHKFDVSFPDKCSFCWTQQAIKWEVVPDWVLNWRRKVKFRKYRRGSR